MTLKTWILGFVLVIAQASWAGPREQLLSLNHQPTVSEILGAFGGHLPDQNPFGTPTAALQTNIKMNAPAVIAGFEKSFPGATFAPLGRDSAFLGDIIDAFYLSLGQQRVTRVSASGDSRTGNERDIVDFIKGLGFEVAHAQNGPAFVMFDQTNWQDSSQSVSYLTAIYKACAATPGCDKAALVEKFNFLNTGATRGMYNQNVLTPMTAITPFLEARKAFLRNGGIRPEHILSISVASNLVYTTEYHETFSKFTRVGDKVTTTPGTLNDVAVRSQVLADVFECIKTAGTPEFRAQVLAEANLLGYEFPLQRVTDTAKIAEIRSKVLTAEQMLGPQRKLVERKLKSLVRSGLSDQALWNALVAETASLNNFPYIGPAVIAEAYTAIVRERPAEINWLANAIMNVTTHFRAGDAEAIKQDPARAEFRRLMKNPVIRKAFTESIPNLIHSGTANWPRWEGRYRQAYLDWSGQNQEEFTELFTRPAVAISEQKVRDLFAGRLSGTPLLQNLISTLNPLRAQYPAEANLLEIKMIAQGVQLGKLDLKHLADSFDRTLQNAQSQLEDAGFRKRYVEMVRRSPYLQQVFDGPLFQQVQRGQLQFVRYQLLAMDLRSQSRTAFAADYIARVIREAKAQNASTDIIVLARQRTSWLEYQPGFAEFYPGVLREVLKATGNSENEKNAIADFTEYMIGRVDPAADEAFGQALHQIVDENPKMQEILRGPLLRKAHSQPRISAFYAKWAKLPEGSTDVLGNESREREFDRQLQEKIAAHMSSDDLVSFTFQTLGNWPDLTLRSRKFMTVMSDLFGKRLISEQGVLTLAGYLFPAFDLRDPSQRAFARSILKKNPKLKKTWDGAIAQWVRQTPLNHIARYRFELLATDAQSNAVPVYRRKVLQGLVDDYLYANNGQANDTFVRGASAELNKLGATTEAAPVDLATSLKWLFEIGEEMVKAKKVPRLALADYVWYALNTYPAQREELVAYFSDRLKHDAFLKELWSHEVIDSYNSLWSRVNAEVREAFLNMSGMSEIDFLKRTAERSIEAWGKALAAGSSPQQGIYNLTRTLAQKDPLGAFLMNVRFVAEFFETNRMTVEDLRKTFGQMIGKEGKDLGALIVPGLREILAAHPAFHKIWDSDLRVNLITNDNFFAILNVLDKKEGLSANDEARVSLADYLKQLEAEFAQRSSVPVGKRYVGQKSNAPEKILGWYTRYLSLPDWHVAGGNLTLGRLMFDEVMAHRQKLGISDHDLTLLLDHLKSSWNLADEKTASVLADWMKDPAMRKFVLENHVPYLVGRAEEGSRASHVGSDLETSKKFIRAAQIESEAARVGFAPLIEELAKAPVGANAGNTTDAGRKVVSALQSAGALFGSRSALDLPKFLGQLESSHRAKQLTYQDELDIFWEVLVPHGGDMSVWDSQLIKIAQTSDYVRDLFYTTARRHLFEADTAKLAWSGRLERLVLEIHPGWTRRDLVKALVHHEIDSLMPGAEHPYNWGQLMPALANWASRVRKQQGDDTASFELIRELHGRAEGQVSRGEVEAFVAGSLLKQMDLTKKETVDELRKLLAELPNFRTTWQMIFKAGTIRSDHPAYSMFYLIGAQTELPSAPSLGHLQEVLRSMSTAGSARSGQETRPSPNYAVLQWAYKEALATVPPSPAAVTQLKREYLNLVLQAKRERYLEAKDGGRLLVDLVKTITANDTSLVTELQAMYGKDETLRELWAEGRQSPDAAELKAIDISPTKRCALAVKRLFGK